MKHDTKIELIVKIPQGKTKGTAEIKVPINAIGHSMNVEGKANPELYYKVVQEVFPEAKAIPEQYKIKK